MKLGDVVTFKDEDGNILQGTIVNIYVVPKNYNLVDIAVDEYIYKGIETSTCTLVE